MRVRWPDCAALRSIEVCGLTPTANTAVGAGRRPVPDRQHSLTRGLVGSSGKVPRHVPGRVPLVAQRFGHSRPIVTKQRPWGTAG